MTRNRHHPTDGSALSTAARKPSVLTGEGQWGDRSIPYAELAADPLGALDRIALQPPGFIHIEGSPRPACLVTDLDAARKILASSRSTKSPESQALRHILGDGNALSNFPAEGDSYYDRFDSLEELRTAKRKCIAPLVAREHDAYQLEALTTNLAAALRKIETGRPTNIYKLLLEVYVRVSAAMFFPNSPPNLLLQLAEVNADLHPSYYTFLRDLRSEPARSLTDRGVLGNHASSAKLPRETQDLLNLRAELRREFLAAERRAMAARICEPGLATTLQVTLGLSAQQLDDALLGFFFASYDTTLTAASWCLFSIAQNLTAQMEVRREAMNLQLRAISSLRSLSKQAPWTVACVKEAMRLYPPLWSLARTLDSTLPMPNPLPSGEALCILPLWTIHRSPAYWQAPLTYRPERFLLSDTDCLYFGAGGRSCLGRNMGLKNILLTVLHFAKAFRLEAPPTAHPKPLLGVVQRPYKDILLTLDTIGDAGPPSAS